MKTYDTYQEAKIANPEFEVAVVTKTDAHTPGMGKFISVSVCESSRGGYSFVDKGKSGSPNTTDGYYTICNPADHCMTVERFLADGHKFVDGDLLLGNGGNFVTVGINYSVPLSNEISASDNKRYILRAAALEEKKPRTKVEHVKSDIESRGQALDAFDNEIELFEWVEGEYKQVTTESDAISKWRNLYERIETPMTEREAFIEALNELFDSNVMSTSDLFNAIVDSGKFKLVN